MSGLEFVLPWIAFGVLVILLLRARAHRLRDRTIVVTIDDTNLQGESVTLIAYRVRPEEVK